MTDRDDLLDLIMTMQAQHQDPENVGDLVDWLIRRRAEAARDQHEASVRLMELGGWWQLMTMQAQHQDPENVGDLVDWLIRRRAEAARDQHEASVRLMELGGWWQLVRRYYGGLGPDALLPVLLEQLKDAEAQS